jgi:hypothetical protein
MSNSNKNKTNFTKLTETISEVLSKTLSKAQLETTLKQLNENQSKFSKLLSVSSSSSSKKAKDPNAPKKPKTGYIFFCQDKRASVKAKDESLSAVDITTKLGELWNALSDKEKKKYNDMSTQDKVRYESDMKDYTPPEGMEPVKKGKKERTGPKKPLSGYMWFCDKNREIIKQEMPELKGKDIPTELGRRWKLLTDKEKEPYLAQHAEDKVRYENEKEGFSEATEATGTSEAVTEPETKPAKGKAKDSKTKQVAVETKPEPAKKGKATVPAVEQPKKGKVTTPGGVSVEQPKKGAKQANGTKQNKQAGPNKVESNKVESTPGFNYFCDEQRDDLLEENPKWSDDKVMTELGKRWGKLSLDEKGEYEECATEL